MYNLYFHGGSTNHGCEAIVRSTVKVLNEKCTLFSFDKTLDEMYGLEKIISLKEDNVNCLSLLERVLVGIYYKIFKSDYLYYKYSRKSFFSKIKKNDIYFSIGGDNYCYQGKERLGYYNKIIHKNNAKTVLWGCSFEVEELNDELCKDIASYDLIIARESISYELLKKMNNNTFLIPDPAFQLDEVKQHFPKAFCNYKIVGINVSPLIINTENKKGIIQKNYELLVKHILETTDYKVALIPHVVEKGNDDREPLMQLYNKFKYTGDVCIIEDQNAMKLKGYISQCELFVGARTHATIAAYSTCVPTLVVGYSVKSIGIARDLFGTEERYVLSIQDINKENDLVDAFDWLNKNKITINNRLNKVIPSYKEACLKSKELIQGLVE